MRGGGAGLVIQQVHFAKTVARPQGGDKVAAAAVCIQRNAHPATDQEIQVIALRVDLEDKVAREVMFLLQRLGDVAQVLGGHV